MPNPIDITNDLDNVHGGRGAGRAVMAAARKGGELLERAGSYVGGAVALKEGWDWLRGNDGGGQKPAPSPSPSPSPSPTPSQPGQ